MPTAPPGSLPCLWMTAGLLTYRLCDREYDCDGCPLDAALRGGAQEAAARRSGGGHRDAAWRAAAARAAEADGDGGWPGAVGWRTGGERAADAMAEAAPGIDGGWPGAVGRPAEGERAGEAMAAGAETLDEGCEATSRTGERGRRSRTAPPSAGSGDRPGVTGGPGSAPPRGDPPDDRFYSPGHTWLQPCGSSGDGRFRFGLDAFAAALLEPPRAVRCAAAGRRLLAGETASELELDGGVLTLALPVAGEVVAANADCRRDPALLVGDPHGDGWLLEIDAAPAAAVPRPGGASAAASPAGTATPAPALFPAAASSAGAAAPVPALFPAPEARRRAVHDLRRFRRRVAFDLLAADDGLGVTLPDGGEPLLDLRGLLGARRHLELVRELVR